MIRNFPVRQTCGNIIDRKSSEDEEIIKRFQRGEERSFDELVNRYQDTVLSTCFRFLQDTSDAKDAAQEIFIKVYRALPDFKAEAKFTTWLYRITANHCLNVLRSRRRRKWLQPFSAQPKIYEKDVMDYKDEHTDPRADLEKEERAALIRSALAALPDDQRTAVILHRYEGLSYKEIADVMHTSVSSVESRLHRAKVKLAQLLEGYFDVF